MSSSISSSDHGSEREGRFHRMARTFVVAAVALMFALMTTIVVVDPYDTGRMALIDKPGMNQTGPRIANASRGRDPSFNAAIFGNSRIQMVEPARLDQATGFKFVHLMVPATHPKEQLVLLDWFLRHHPEPKALVLGLDERWCAPRIYNDKPFPFWLYDADPLAYLRGLMRYDSLDQLMPRLTHVFGGGKRARPDGYWNYEADYLGLGYGDPAYVHKKLYENARPEQSDNPGNVFPAADALVKVLDTLPASTQVVLAFPPRYLTMQPAPGSSAAATEQACHAVFAAYAARRAGTAVVDFSGDTEANREPSNFFDRIHYRQPYAERFADAIAAALKQGRPQG